MSVRGASVAPSVQKAVTPDMCIEILAVLSLDASAKIFKKYIPKQNPHIKIPGAGPLRVYSNVASNNWVAQVNKGYVVLGGLVLMQVNR